MQRAKKKTFSILSLGLMSLMAFSNLSAQIIIPDDPFGDESSPPPEKDTKPSGNSANVTPQARGVVAAAERLLRANTGTRELPGAALQVNYRHKPVVVDGYNLAPDAPISVASISKTMTGMVVIQLVRMGKLQVDDPVMKYFPEAKALNISSSKPITIRHLLQHRSGIPYRSGARVRVAGINIPKPKLAPGVAFQYSNPNYRLVAKIVSKVTGQSFHKAVQKYVIDEFNLSNTVIASGASGASGVRSCPEDLSKLADYLIRDFEKKGSRSWLSQLALNPEGIPATGNNAYYGLGWRVTMWNGEIFSMHHYGDWHKGVGIFYVFPQHSASFSYVANPPRYDAGRVKKVKLALINKAVQFARSLDRVASPRIANSGLNVVSDKKSIYPGKYKNPENGKVIQVTRSGSSLYLKRDGKTIPLKYQSDWEFEGDSEQFSVQFYFDQSDKVAGMFDLGDFYLRTN